MLYIEMGPNSDKCKICSCGANTDKEHILNEKRCWKKNGDHYRKKIK